MMMVVIVDSAGPITALFSITPILRKFSTLSLRRYGRIKTSCCPVILRNVVLAEPGNPFITPLWYSKLDHLIWTLSSNVTSSDNSGVVINNYDPFVHHCNCFEVTRVDAAVSGGTGMKLLGACRIWQLLTEC
ncbi:unnamed protein product [Ceratitis capitata]|uniref:(Mediterranean fruit fly) hypothetical protein n=1 Tax=Ceratitis capitata TaxID=7213 RepID=A0A811USQ0_CERCA|nr:unnamed protein product [Ceratitis capitata]